MSASLLMATSSSDGDRSSVTCPTCDFTASVPHGSRRTICPKCGGFYSREAAERPDPRRVARRQRVEKEAQGSSRRGIQKIANFFNNFSQDNSAKEDQNGFNGAVTASNSDASSGKSTSNLGAELPPINSNGRLTASNNNSRSTTPSYAVDSRGSARLSNQSKLSTPRQSHRSDKDRDGGINSNSSMSSYSTDHRGRPSNQTKLSPTRQNVEKLTDKSETGKTGAGAGPRKSPSHRDRVVYPVRTKTSSQLREDVRLARETGNWTGVQEFYSTTFESFLEINAAFKRDPDKEYKNTEDPGIKFEFVSTVFDLLLGLPKDIQKVVLKSIINSLLKDKRPHTKDDLRAYLILLQNPQFASSTTFVIFAHLLRQISALTDHDHHYLVYWLRKISSDRFKTILQRLNSFISVRLFPPKPQELPEMSKCSWWIPGATKVMALLNAANNLCLPPIVSYMDFYNPTLDNLDLMSEYAAWQDPNSAGGFSFCQYPFIISITGKRSILQQDSEKQMILMARRSLVAKVQRRQLPDVGMLFFNLTVRREHLVMDSLNEISRKQHDLKKKLKVTFAGEPGLDMGGLTKEWFLLLIRQIFHENYGMFTYNKQAGIYWFTANHCESYQLQEFNLVGVLMGLAVYNSIILDLRFPPCCYKKLLSPPVVPFNNPRVPVGVANLTLNDLKQVHPDIAKGLTELLAYDGDVEEDFCMSFQVTSSTYGSVKTTDLKPDGANIPVTKENRKEYVDLYVDWLLNKSIFPQFKAFYHGFHTVCASNALIMLRPEEIDMLVCGNPRLDMKELKKVTRYDGYNSGDQPIRYFWDIVLNARLGFQKQLLMFTTGSDRIPIGGMSEMTFKITKTEDTDLLPMSHTCFNQLVLPAYKSKKHLRHKLTLAVQNAEGFGLE